jgi:hypothetical protein
VKKACPLSPGNLIEFESIDKHNKRCRNICCVKPGGKGIKECRK